MKKNILVIILLCLSGCAFGHKIQYRGTSSFDINFPNTMPIIVAVQEKRINVLNDVNSETFVGWQRALAGIPYGVHTESHRPLSTDFSELIVNRFKEKGFQVTEQLLDLHSDKKVISQYIDQDKDQRILYFEIVEWQTDTYFSTTLDYALAVTVYDEHFSQICKNSVSGSERLARGAPKRSNLAEAVSDILTKLLSEPEIINALNGTNIKNVKKDTDPAAEGSQHETSPSNSSYEKLKTLKKLHQNGLINNDEYDSQKNKILNSM